jgi:uncharacterized protein YqhQ
VATLIFGLVLAFGLFLAAPVLGTKGVGVLLGGSIENPILFNLVEGAIRIAIFMLYLVGITAISKDIRRFFAYHGAEHKAIKVYERGEELVPENARKLDTSHVRCGTSFILYVLVLSILIFSLLPIDWWVEAILSRVVVIPLVAGIAFEFIMWSAKNQANPVVKALIWPGLQLQKLTTREPTDDQVEVAMASLKKVLAKEDEARIAPDATNKLVI